MTLDTRYIADASLQQYLVNKDDGAPLAGGKIFFYSDTNRTAYKTVYQLVGDPTIGQPYSYVPLPNPVILSSVGKPQDSNGNYAPIYYFPFVSEEDDTVDLYYVVIQSSTGVPQYTLSAWPPDAQPAEQPSDNANIVNLIPNGQFLIHNKIPDDTLTTGSNIIAQGGWTVEMPNVLHSTNLVRFYPVNSIGQWTNNPPQSPAYQVQILCTSSSSSDQKSLRIKFYDVNKFSSEGIYTFGFSAQASASTLVDISVYKDFGAGGSTTPPPLPQGSATITTAQDFYQFQIVFAENEGTTTGTDSFVAIDIGLPNTGVFDLKFTDFVLLEGDLNLNDNYIVQTNADMITRSIMGWTDIPDYNNADLYLSPVLTPEGMSWDRSQIGKIYATLTDPARGELLCDGSSYVTSAYSSDGVPYSRLFNVMWNSTLKFPLSGTGSNYLSAYVSASNSANLRITTNIASGSSIAAPTNGNGLVFTYTAIHLSSASTFRANVLSGTEIVVQNTALGTTAIPTAGTTSFSISDYLVSTTGRAYFYLTVVAASSISGGQYITFSSPTTNYYLWFKVNGSGVDPAPGGTGIQVDILSTYTAAEVAQIVREAICGFQIYAVNCTNAASVPQSAYMSILTSTNGYRVWFNKDGAGIAPSAGGQTLIEVAISTGQTAAQVAAAIQTAMNGYQYAVPDLRGVFLRGNDLIQLNDPDSGIRFSPVSTFYGANVGSFEFNSFQQHLHAQTSGVPSVGGGFVAGGGNVSFPSQNTAAVGRYETAPVNMAVNYVIKY